MDIRSFFNKPAGGKSSGTNTKKQQQQPAKKSTSTPPKPKPKPKPKTPIGSKKRASSSVSSSTTAAAASSSLSPPPATTATTTTANGSSSSSKKRTKTPINTKKSSSSGGTTKRFKSNTSNDTRNGGGGGDGKKIIEIDSDATTDDEMDAVRKTAATTTTKRMAEVDLDATTDEDTNDNKNNTTTTAAVRNVDLDATTDEDVQDDKKKTITKSKKVEIDLDATTDEDVDDDGKKKKKKMASRNKKIEMDSDATTDDNMDMEKTLKTTIKKKKVAVDLDATTDDGDDDNDNDNDDDTPSRRRRGRAASSIKNNDSDTSETDDDFEVGSSKRPKKFPAKRVHNTKRPRARPSIDDEEEDDFDDDNDNDDDDADEEFCLNEDTNKEDSSEEEQLGIDTDDDDVSMSLPLKKKSSRTSPTTPSKSKSVHKKTTPAKPKPRSTPKPKTKASPKKKPKKEAPPKPTQSITSYPHSSATPQCLSGYTFVFTGNMPDLPRDTAEEYVKILGGRVTTAVSGKTNYLVCGEILEDDRPVEEGSKFKKATALGEEVVVILKGEGDFYGIVKLLDERVKGDNGADATVDEEGMDGRGATQPAKGSASLTPDAPPAVKNPYARAKPANPYASKAKPANPYARRSTTSVSSSINTPSSPKRQRASLDDGNDKKYDATSDPNALWADKYAPQCTGDILGNRENVNKLTRWLSSWEDTFNTSGKKRPFGGPTGPRKAALLSGPPGIGKTTTAVLVGKESGRHVLEMNASDTRSKKSLETGLGDVTGSQVLSFEPIRRGSKKSGHSNEKRRCIIMDEVDGMGAGDRSGMAELIKMIKGSKVPIICICNDRQSQKIRTLAGYCLDLRYRRPVKTVIGRRAIEIGNMEGMDVEPNAAEAIAESCGNDIRQVLNVMQMWANKKHESLDQKADITYKDLKARTSFISKDEILRVSMFDATKLIVEGRRGLQDADPKTEVNSLFKRTDAFFTDYSLMGINVHQNYLKVCIPPFQKTRVSGDMNEELKCLENMYEATRSMSDFAVAEESLRTEQNWSLLPLCSMLVVKSGHHAGGENGGFLSGYPEFAGWLGKNSSRGRKIRLLQELSHHMNYKISADGTDLRLGYLPVFREMFVNLLMSGDKSKVTEAIELMDEYGLDRDDVFENLDEFTLDPKAKKMADLDSKTKAAFTREYNKGIHKSQALVDEQGVTKTRRKPDNDVNDEDGDNNEVEESEEEEEDIDSVQKLFNKKGKGTGKKKASTAKGGKKRAASSKKR